MTRKGKNKTVRLIMAADWTGGFVTARLPRDLKRTISPGEQLAHGLCNWARDFCD